MSLLLLFLVLGIVAWTLAHPSPPHWSDDPAWRQELRQWRRARRRTNWAAVRQACRTDLWHTGDAVPVLGLLALAVIVIAVCR